MTPPIQKIYKIALLGLGTVGAEIINLWQNNSLLKSNGFSKQINNNWRIYPQNPKQLPLEIIAVAAKNKNKNRNCNIQTLPFCDQPMQLLDYSPDCLIEVTGSTSDAVVETIAQALEKGINVISANKALLAQHGDQLWNYSRIGKAHLYYEAAVGGAVPIIKFLNNDLFLDRAISVSGILNGTCNFILSEMHANDAPLLQVLADAQSKGYAEAEPSSDLEGWDSCYKLKILLANLFSYPIKKIKINTKGITAIKKVDIQYAKHLKTKIKLLAYGGITKNQQNQKIEITGQVEPVLISSQNPLYSIDGVNNAVELISQNRGKTTISAPGAGAKPTVAAIMSDLATLTRRTIRNIPNIPNNNNQTIPDFQIAEHLKQGMPPLNETLEHIYEENNQAIYQKYNEMPFFFRIEVVECIGVMAKLTTMFANAKVSLKNIDQAAPDISPIDAENYVSIMVVTHRTEREKIYQVTKQLDKCLIKYNQPNGQQKYLIKNYSAYPILY